MEFVCIQIGLFTERNYDLIQEIFDTEIVTKRSNLCNDLIVRNFIILGIANNVIFVNHVIIMIPFINPCVGTSTWMRSFISFFMMRPLLPISDDPLDEQ